MSSFASNHEVSGADGALLRVFSAGPLDGDIVLCLHGIGQSALAWSALSAVAGQHHWRVIAADLRGHGESDKPLDAYGDSQLWAQDVQALLTDAGASADARAILVGWSYGGAVLTDYLTVYGDALVRAVATAGATNKLGPAVGAYIQPASGALTKRIMTEDGPAIAADLLDLCTSTPLEPAYREALLVEAVKCPAHVRNSMFRRQVDNDAAVAAFGGAWLVTHGTRDQMFTAELGKHLAETAPNGSLSSYVDAGHLPLWDDPARFIRELDQLIKASR